MDGSCYAALTSALHKTIGGAALAHEMTHVVIADRFVEGPLPRWIDEGIAILADTREKRRGHTNNVRRTVAAGAHFRLAELLTLADYPPQGRWGAFYDQSAALVEFLVEQQGHAQFVAFVELSIEHGYDRALEEIYGCGVGELERRWHRSLTVPTSSTLGGNFPSDNSPGAVSDAAGDS